MTGYVEFLQERKLAPVSIRHYLEPISITGNYMAEEYEGVYRPIKALGLAPSLLPPSKKFLSGVELETVIAEALAGDYWRAALGFTLGGWCGLNLREIVRRKASDFDFEAGFVRITESKNRFRERTIPLPSFVVEFVAKYLAAQVVKDSEGRLVVPPPGKEPEDRHLYKTMRHVLRVCAKKHPNGQFGSIAPKDLRKTFVNIAANAGVERETLRRYIGHVPADVLSMHYESFNVERFRRDLIPMIEKAAVVAKQGPEQEKCQFCG